MNLCTGKIKDPLIAHPAQLTGKSTAVHTEEICQFCPGVGQTVTAFFIGCQGLKINLQPIPQTLLGKNTHLCIEEQKLLRHILHQISGHLHPTGAGHGLLGHERTEIQPEHRTV